MSEVKIIVVSFAVQTFYSVAVIPVRGRISYFVIM